MVGESLTTRLARERLAAIKKFIPVRDRVREKLQRRQEMQTDLSVSSEQLFAPITSATKDVKTATERAIYGDIPKEGQRREMPILGVLEKIAAETEQTRAGIQQLSGDLQTQRDDSASPEDIEEPQPAGEIAPIGVSFIDKLTEEAITTIKRPQLMKTSDYRAFGNFAAQSFHSKKDFLKDKYKNSKINRDEWANWLYKTNKGIGCLNTKELGYKEFIKGIDDYDAQQQQEILQRRELKKQ